jgi:predicted ribosome quality control (RQC) complex YloA/Tae2 family protein
MIRHYYTLAKIVEELQFLKGLQLTECFTQERNSLVLTFSDIVQEYYLQYSGDTRLGGIYLRHAFMRARKNTIDLFQPIIGNNPREIILLPNERIIKMVFNGFELYFFIFGGSKSNVILTDNEQIIVDSFKNKKKLVTEKFLLPENHLKKIGEFSPDTKIVKALADCDALLGKYYAEELCLRMNIQVDEELTTTKLNLAEIERLAYELKDECLQSEQFYLLRDEKCGLLFSLIPFKAYPDTFKSFQYVNEAVFQKVKLSYGQRKFDDVYNKYLSGLSKMKERLERSIAHLGENEKRNERVEKYKQWADALSTLSNSKIRAGASIEVILWDESKVAVPLNPKHTIRENCELYYQKIKDAKEADKIRELKLPKLKGRLKAIEETLEQLKDNHSIKDLEIYEKNNLKILKNIMEDEKQEQAEKFKKFELEDDYIIYVGKSAANNDELTMHFAKPNDIWLHARGTGGSHTVLRMKGKEEKPPKLILQKAAEIAAYYSQARKGKFVPVAYTYKKYVHKPKGANPGSVVISKEQVLMVEPKIPDNEAI